MANTALLALTTEANLQLAEQLASTLVERQLAACVALKPVTSIYRWQGQIERSEEVQILIRATQPVPQPWRRRCGSCTATAPRSG